MSSPDGLRYSQADFLARWMPSSERAGVILNPSTGLAGSLRLMSAVGSSPMKPDDSFASDFAPLPGSADSSCLAVDGPARPASGDTGGTDRPVDGLYPGPRHPDVQMDSVDEMANESQDLPLMIKLEQLRKWQQHMQEQLKAHQLEELLRLQEEQQRLLGMISGPEDFTADHSKSLGLSQTGRLEWTPMGETHEEVDNKEGDSWISSDQEKSYATSHFQEPGGKLMSFAEDHSIGEDASSQERPIKPGIGHKQTFEDLLEEQLRLEDQRLKSAQQQQRQDGAKDVQGRPKRAFLKRGQGLTRFTNHREALLPKKEAKKDSRPRPQARGISRSNSEPVAFHKGGPNCTQRLPVQRKTAILNKENRLKSSGSPPQDIKAENKTARTVLGSYHRQNMEISESIQNDHRQSKQYQLGQVKEQNNRTVGLSAQTVRKPGSHNMQPNPVTKQVSTLGVSGKAENYSAKERGHRSEVGLSEERMDSEGGGDEVSVASFELSFQEKLQRWDCDRQLECMELGEFELLEQAAEELSFSSNSSFVTKVIQMDQHHRQLSATRGLHHRRLSSTPIKSPPRGALQRSNSEGVSCKSSSANSEAFVGKEDLATQDKEGQHTGREGELQNSDVLSPGGSDVEDQEAVVKPPLVPSNFSFPAQSNPPYDRWSYQDEDSGRSDVSSEVTHGGDGESDSALSNADESTLIEEQGGQQGRVVFDDDDSWNDMEETTVQPANESRGFSPVSKAMGKCFSPPVPTLLRKVAVSKCVDQGTAAVVGSTNPEPAHPPPASQLMTRLFPSLRPKAQNAPLPPPAAFVAPEPERTEAESGQQVQSRQLRERLVELEIEIERFKKENATLAKLRQESEKNGENLRKERLEFEQMKAEELAKFEEYKKEENKKLQRERKLFEKHVSAARAIPDKKEREEIQALKQQLSSLQEELRRKESRWASSHSRQRNQIDSLGHDNSSLRDEIRVLEKLRISAWKKSTVGAEKDKEAIEGPRSASTVSSVTKGVKFASPLDSRVSSISPPQSSALAASRRSSVESGLATAAGIKSSLRRPSGAGTSSSSFSSSLPGRRIEERSAAAKESPDKPASQEQPKSSPERGYQPKEPECSVTEEEESAQEVITHPDGKVEKILAGGDRLIVFPNGTRKEVSADGLTVKVTFFNKDTKEVTADQRVIYYYSEAQTTHITYPDGMEVLHFHNNQTEKHFPDGRKEITFPDQTVKNLFPSGREESVLTDGTIIQVNPDGTKEIHFNTGQKEIHTGEYKRREYPDGTVKTVYADGRQETSYPTGRIRIKDKDGNVILDNRA